MRLPSGLFHFFIPAVLALWPIPSTFTNGSQVLWIDQGLLVIYNAPSQAQVTFTSSSNTPSSQTVITDSLIVETAIRRMYNSIFTQNFVPWKLHPRGSSFEPTLSAKSPHIKSISLVQTALDGSSLSQPLDGQIDESYTLDIAKSGAVTIKAPSSIGIAHGLTTFTQFFFAHSSSGAYMTMAPVHVIDTPLFPHRGLNMDVSRDYYPVASITRTLDALALNKMNRLHLHITDSQAWALDIPSMPQLAGKGAYSSSSIYSAADLRKIQMYGASLGIEVYLEIDMPGHTGSVHYAYPDLVTAFNVQPNWANYSAEPPSGQLKLNSSGVYDFLGALWDDLLPRLSKAGARYMHTGGDEINLNAYDLDNTVNSNDPAVINPLLQKFIDFNHARIRAAGLAPVVWEEILLDHSIKLGSDVVVQTWLGDESVSEVVQQGHKVLASSYNYWYLDCGQGQWVDAVPGQVEMASYPFTDWCSPRKSWRLAYSYDPLSSVPSSLAHLVLGGEAHIWSEQTDAQNIDRMLWPRLSAVAEVLWSGAKDARGQNRSQITASPRLAEMRERLVARGIAAEPVHMVFCTQGIEQCVLWD